MQTIFYIFGQQTYVAVLERSNSQVSYNYFNKEATALFKESDPNICGISLGDTMVSNDNFYLFLNIFLL